MKDERRPRDSSRSADLDGEAQALGALDVVGEDDREAVRVRPEPAKLQLVRCRGREQASTGEAQQPLDAAIERPRGELRRALPPHQPASRLVPNAARDETLDPIVGRELPGLECSRRRRQAPPLGDVPVECVGEAERNDDGSAIGVVHDG